MTTIAELKSMRHLDTDLVQLARHFTGHGEVELLCNEKHIHVYTTAGAFSVEWIDWEYGGKTNHAATAAAIEKRLAKGDADDN